MPVTVALPDPASRQQHKGTCRLRMYVGWAKENSREAQGTRACKKPESQPSALPLGVKFSTIPFAYAGGWGKHAGGWRRSF